LPLPLSSAAFASLKLKPQFLVSFFHGFTSVQDKLQQELEDRRHARTGREPPHSSCHVEFRAYRVGKRDLNTKPGICGQSAPTCLFPAVGTCNGWPLDHKRKMLEVFVATFTAQELARLASDDVIRQHWTREAADKSFCGQWSNFCMTAFMHTCRPRSAV